MSRILIVEDEESIAELEKDYLELSGFEVEMENNGEAGLKRGLEEDFDLLILDLMLPGIDGFEICKKVREVKNTPIITVSYTHLIPPTCPGQFFVGAGTLRRRFLTPDMVRSGR